MSMYLGGINPGLSSYRTVAVRIVVCRYRLVEACIEEAIVGSIGRDLVQGMMLSVGSEAMTDWVSGWLS